MTAPNLITATTMTGVTTAINIADVNTSNIVVSNPSGSNTVYKINSILAANIDGTASADVTIKYTLAAAGAGTSISLASTLPVPADSSAIILGKDYPIYLEENRSIIALASAANDISVICSYEIIG